MSPSSFNKSDITIVYIAGYGRSGSTLLDILLSNANGVRSLGEQVAVWCHFSVCQNGSALSLDKHFVGSL